MPKSLIGKITNKANHPIPFGSPWNTRGGLYGSGPQDRFTMLNSMGTQGTLFAIIQLLSTGANAFGGWKMFRKDKDGRVRYARTDTGSDQRVEVLEHQALKLWNRPNKFMTGVEFREIGWQHMELAGEWYWVMDRGPSGKGLPIEMWPVRPDRMEPVPDPDNFLAGWVYTGPSGEAVPLMETEVIQLRYPHPTDYYRGMSAVQALLADIDAAKYSAEWSRNFFLNSAQPGGIVTFDKRLSDEEFTEFSERWREQHQGVARGHRVGVLEQGAMWSPNTYTMHDMQFAELRGVTSDMIRQGYRIHQSMLGNSTDVNRANAQTAEEVHISWHEVPRLERTKNIMNTKYLECFGAKPLVEFDYEDPRVSSANDANDELTAKTAAASALVAAGWDPADVLEMVGLPEMKYKGLPKPPAPAGTGSGPGTGSPPSGKPKKKKGQPDRPPTKTPAKPEPGQENKVGLEQMIREAFSEARDNGNGHRTEELV